MPFSTMRILIFCFFILTTVYGKCGNETCVYGKCINDICICDPGICGEICNKDIIDCDADSCLNNSTCIELINGFACQCLPDFDGSRCQYRQTKNDNHCRKKCSNNGKCIIINNTEKCLCSPKYDGSDCEYIHNNHTSSIRKCPVLKFRNSSNEATCLAIGLTPLFDIHCECYYADEEKHVLTCQITSSPYSNQTCSFQEPIRFSSLSTLPDPLSIRVCPVNWKILDQYENTQEKVNSVHVTRCRIFLI